MLPWQHGFMERSKLLHSNLSSNVVHEDACAHILLCICSFNAMPGIFNQDLAKINNKCIRYTLDVEISGQHCYSYSSFGNVVAKQSSNLALPFPW